MFHFFKRQHKEPLPIFQALGTDMHCHLLPKVDDGSKGEDMSAICLRIMKQAGFDNVFLTPHYQSHRFPNVEEDILRRYDEFKDEMLAAGTGDKPNLVGVAGEYRVDAIFDKRIEANKFLLIGGKYLLIEFSLHQQVLGLEETIFQLQLKGYDIILAHPERYPYYTPSSHVLERLKDMGVYFQVNFLSLGGYYDENARRKGFELIDKGWVEFLGSDLHNTHYAQSLINCTYDKQVQRVLEKHTFLNNQILNPQPQQHKTI